MSTALVKTYAEQLADTDPKAAVAIVLAEAERQRAIAEQEKQQARVMSEVEFLGNGSIARANLAGLYRLGVALSQSTLVPEAYRNQPQNCFIACQMAMRMKIDPFAYMQNSYVVHGRPGIEAKLAIAMLNESGKIKGRIRYTMEGDGKTRQCTATATDAATGDEVAMTVDWKMVEAEKWHLPKKTQVSKWMTMPEVMFRYRSAIFLIRTCYPEVLMGIQTREELEDAGPCEDPRPPVETLDDLAKRLAGPDTVEGKVEGVGAAAPIEPDNPRAADSTAIEDATAVLAGCTTAKEVAAVADGWLKDHPEVATGIEFAANRRLAEIEAIEKKTK